MNYIALVLSAFIALNYTKSGDYRYDPREWQLFKAEHGKVYESGNVENLRRQIFAYNKQRIDEFNELESQEAGFTLGLNHLSDLGQPEIAHMNGFKLPNNYEHLLKNSESAQRFLDAILQGNATELPDAIDWRNQPGRVSPVKDQGFCGSCWAFASTGALEGQEKVRGNLTGGNLVELSEQNLVDCVTKDLGCGGGIMQDAFDYVSGNGIDDEKSYPYEGITRRCRFQKDKVAFKDSGSAVLPSGDEESLKKAVANFGPVSVAIDAGGNEYQDYKDGVYFRKGCHNEPKKLNHAVLVVGYGTDPKKGDYWIVKNSWGPTWGKDGYMLMARNKKNHCGIATLATIPTFQ